ncbi:MAG: LTA synthase family protein [Deltaproteobacteria bacterium]|nr:LTA synthase family protein [Deltaproteobacteria bacterium]
MHWDWHWFRPWAARIRRAATSRYGAFVFGFVIYIQGMALFFGLRARHSQYVVELPLLLAVFAALVEVLRPARWRAVAAAFPIVIIYLGHDLYMLVYREVPDWREFARISELYDSLSWPLLVLLTSALAAPVGLWVWQLDRGRLRSRRAGGLIALLLLVASVMWAPRLIAGPAHALLPLQSWSHWRNVRFYGRLSMSLVRQAEQRIVREQLAQYSPSEESRRSVDPAFVAALERRNVHIVVLESFFDPRLFTAVRYDVLPVPEEFAALFDGHIGGALSPAFGGGTSRAEMEVLCGVPALGIFGSEEFNVFTGAPTPCLPNLLADAGFATQLAYPFKPSFYNAQRAYRGLGFASLLFGDRFAPAGSDALSLARLDDRYLFDSHLYDEILARTRAHRARGTPLLSYVLTMYGHTPYVMNEAVRPRRVRLVDHEEPLATVVNMAWYRAEAMARFVPALFAVDPDAMLVLVADHLPPMPLGAMAYDRWGYRGRFTGDSPQRFHENFVAVFDRGVPVDVGLVRHYQLFDLLLDRLSRGAWCAKVACERVPPDLEREVYLDDYTRILGLAARSLP